MWFSDIWVPELLPPPMIIRMFCPAGSFGTLLVGWLVVVARGLYLARHLSTLCDVIVRK